jgi:iron complex outermembrane receptor protein
MKRVLVILFFLIVNKLFAQDSLRVDSILYTHEVVVTYQANPNTPVTYQDISGNVLKNKSTGQEPSFLLSETPSITAYSDAGNTQGYSYYRMRGMDQTRINTTLDGVPLNEPEDQGAYFSNYPDIMNSVSRLQIQRGVGTSMNGAASYAGSVQLFSPNLSDSAKTTVGVGYGSFNSLRAFASYNSGIKNKKALYARGSEIYSDGYKYHSSNHSQSIFVSGGLFYDRTTWKINVLAGHQQNQLAWLGVPDSLIKMDRRTNANKNEKDNFAQCLVQLQNTWHPLKKKYTLQSSLYYTFLNGNYDFNLNGFLGLPSTNELYNYAFQSNLVGFYSNFNYDGKNYHLTAGVHGNMYNRTHTGSETNAGQLYSNNGFKNEASAFVKADYTIHKFTFFADVQYRYASFDYKGTVPFKKLDWNFVNPKAGISYAVQSNALFYYSIGSTGREPTRNDMFGGNDDLLADSLGKAIIPITTPEYVLDQELGFRYRTGKFILDANLYYLAFQNEIVLNGKFGPNGLALTNRVKRSFREGVEVSVTYKLNKAIRLINNSSFNYSRIEEQTQVFSPVLTPPLIINQEITYSYRRLILGVTGRYQDRSFIDFANTATVNAYFMMNARVAYQFGKVQATAFFNNLTNTKYFNNGYVDTDGTSKYFVQAPTNFYLSLKCSL